MAHKITLNVEAPDGHPDERIEIEKVDDQLLRLTMIDGYDDVWETFLWNEEAATLETALRNVRTTLPIVSEPVPEWILATQNWPRERLHYLIDFFIQEEQPLLIQYVKECGEEVYRVISPYEINGVKDSVPTPSFYLRAWDHTREGIRSFRLARIKGVRPEAATTFRAPVKP